MVCQDSPQSDIAAWRAVRQRTGAKLPPDEGNHCGPRAAFFLSRIGLTISAPVLPLSDANVCNRSRKRLQPPPQTFASVIVNVCGKNLHLASVPASTCVRDRLHLGIFPMLFLQSHPHKYFTITPLPEGQYQHKMSHKHSAAWRAVP